MPSHRVSLLSIALFTVRFGLDGEFLSRLRPLPSNVKLALLSHPAVDVHFDRVTTGGQTAGRGKLADDFVRRLIVQILGEQIFSLDPFSFADSGVAVI